MVTAALPRTSATPRWHHLLQLAAAAALLGVFASVMPANEAVGAGAGSKLFLLLRMASLVLLCTWLLRRGGERWADVGLRRPPRWWTVPLLVVGGFVLLIVVSTVLYRVVLPAIGAQPPELSANRAMRGDFAEYLFWAVPWRGAPRRSARNSCFAASSSTGSPR